MADSQNSLLNILWCVKSRCYILQRQSCEIAESQIQYLKSSSFVNTEIIKQEYAHVLTVLPYSYMIYCKKNCPSLKFCFDLPLYYTAASQTSNSNISSKFETEFENILGYGSVFQVGSFDEKNQSQKISCYCPFYIGFFQYN